MLDWNKLFAPRMARVVGSDIRERMKLLGAKSIVHLGGGLPDPGIFPYAAIAASAAAILGDPARARTALQYAPSEGHPPLREWLIGYMASIGVDCGADNILITNGSQQGLDLAAKLLVDKGDPVIVEMPSFIGALRAVDVYEPRYIPLPAGAADWSADNLEPAKLAYVGPDFRNPTGTTMTRAERERLLDTMTALGTPILEDGCYEKLRYDGEDIPSVMALACQRHGDIEDVGVIYTGTFSKTVAPSLRVGWMVAPTAVIRKLTLLKQAADLATSALNQMILLDIVSQRLADDVAVACTLYRERRDSMLGALSEFMPPGVSWTEPEGGLYIWVTLPVGTDGATLARRALAEGGVSVIAGSAFYPIDPLPNTIRLSFSLATSADARVGIQSVAKLIGETGHQMPGDETRARY